MNDWTVCRGCVRKNIHSGTVTYNTILTTAIDIVVDSAAADGNICQFDNSQLRPYRVSVTIKLCYTSHRTAKDVATYRVSCSRLCRFVTNGTTADSNGDMTMFLRIFNATILIFIRIIINQTIRRIRCAIFQGNIFQTGSHRSQTATAIDRAQHGATRNSHRHISYNSASCQCLTTEATTTTEDVTINVGGTPRTYLNIRMGVCCLTNSNTATNVYSSVSKYVTILTTTEDGAEDAGGTRDVHLCFAYIRPLIEEYALVTLTGTEEVAGHGVSRHLFVCTRHTECTTHHVDGTLALVCYDGQIFSGTDISHLVTAIDTGQDMTANDIYYGIATHITCLAMPLTRFIRILT